MSGQTKAPKTTEQYEDGSITPQEPFDYSAVPNILDDIPTPEHDMTPRKKKKQKQNKGELAVCTSLCRSTTHFRLAAGGVIEYGNFPAPPKAHRELKSGNQSFTFK